jgi:hypothetical protein
MSAGAGESVNSPLVLGIDTFGDLIHDEHGQPRSQAETIRSVVEQGVHAEAVGVGFFGIGEWQTIDPDTSR